MPTRLNNLGTFLGSLYNRGSFANYESFESIDASGRNDGDCNESILWKRFSTIEDDGVVIERQPEYKKLALHDACQVFWGRSISRCWVNILKK